MIEYKHFAGKTAKFPKYTNMMLAKYTDLITFGEELLENKQVPYEGLVIETSNAQHGMFSFKPNHCNQMQVFCKQKTIPKHQYLHRL